MARWYANQHRKADPAVVRVYYLPTGAPEREIRLIEVNTLIAERDVDVLEPVDFGIDAGTDNSHKLLVLDVTPKQWERILNSKLRLPLGWSLVDKRSFPRES